MWLIVLLLILILFALGTINNTLSGREAQPMSGGQAAISVVVILLVLCPVVLLLPLLVIWSWLSTISEGAWLAMVFAVITMAMTLGIARVVYVCRAAYRSHYVAQR